METMRAKLAGLGALGAVLMLAACGDGYSESAGRDTPPPEAAVEAPAAEDAAKDAAATVPAEEVPETPAEPVPYEPGEVPPPPEKPKSEEIFY